MMPLIEAALADREEDACAEILADPHRRPRTEESDLRLELATGPSVGREFAALRRLRRLRSGVCDG